MTQQEIQERNEQIAIMLGYKLITPDMRRNPDKWNMSYWQKDYTKKLGSCFLFIRIFYKLAKQTKHNQNGRQRISRSTLCI